jgi:hypothetical protein
MYASKDPKGGQRPSVGRAVVIRPEGEALVEAATITRIPNDDSIEITSMYDGREYGDLTFVETRTEADIEALPPNAWTWPVRV